MSASVGGECSLHAGLEKAGDGFVAASFATARGAAVTSVVTFC